MKNLLSFICFLLSAVCLVSCGNGGKTLTSATGTIYECLVVMDSRALSQENTSAIAAMQTPTGSAYEEPVATTYDMVRLTLGADMPCLPQMEPYFKLTQVPMAAFDNYLKPTRNILYVDINPERYTLTKAKVSTNRWSKPQAFYHIQAPSDDAFVAYWLEHGNEVREWFVTEEMRRQVSFYRASTNKEARAALERRMEADMLIPEDFMLIMDTTITINPSSAASSSSKTASSSAQHLTNPTKWVLILSTMPGGYITGSGTMYFVGTMTPEGYFLADEGDYPLWLDYGADNYAAVSWNNAPDDRVVSIGWMNNWDYAPACPAFPWKSAMTLPREYSLRDIDGKLVLCSEPVYELETLAGEWQTINPHQAALLLHQVPGTTSSASAPHQALEAYELEATISLTEDAAITLSNAAGEQYEVRIDSRCRKIISDRSRAGQSHFSSLFAAPSMSAPIEGQGSVLTLRLIVDQSSVELFADGGATCVTNTVYPSAIYNRVETKGEVQNLRFRHLSSIWLPTE